MFGVGWTEMLVIGVVALIVIGPKDLPMVMNRMGKVLGSIRRMGTEFQREINKTTGLDQITDIRRSITEPLKKTASDIRSEFNKITPTGTTVPSGVIAPKDPAAESVVAEIQEKVGMTPPAPVMKPLKSVESPAPVEAIATAKPARKPRAKKATVAKAAPIIKAPPVVATVEPPTAKPKAPRKPRAPKPKADA